MVEIRPATLEDLSYVAERMREWDRREIFATLWIEQPFDFARLVDRMGGYSRIAHKDQTPVAAIGAFEATPRVWSAWAFGTDRFPEVGLSLTRFATRQMIPDLIEDGCHRIECRSMEGHTEAHKWLVAMGFHREGEHPGFGKDGETFYTYAWLGQIARPQTEKEAA